MAVGQINAAKELAVTYQPLLLAEITLSDGVTKLRLCSHGLRNADGGFQYGGYDWLPRIMNQDVAATQALSEQGIDQTPNVTLQIADPDKFVWLNYEQAKGLKGARMKLLFVFWNVGQNDFSSDSVVKFVGVCNAPTVEESSISVTAVSLMNMSQVNLPPTRIQKKCPWIFPQTAEQRQDGADNDDSPFWECGYCPDHPNPASRRGNLNGGTPYTTCGYTKDDCVARGMYTKDSALRQTGRFGGVQWSPPQSTVSRGFVSSKWEEITSNGNEAKYGDFVPLVYGTQWVDPLILNVNPDANLTKMEALICWGEMSHIYEVVVNDVKIPHVNNDGEFMSSYKEGGNTTSGFWLTVNRGDRDGSPCADQGYTDQFGVPQGDPYGSLSVIEIVVPRKLADSSSIPRVRVHVKGPKIRVYSDPNTYTKQYTDNPVWILLDILAWANWRMSDIDIQSFIDAAAKCDAQINFTNQFGQVTNYMNGQPYRRYMAGLVLRQRRSAAEVIRGLRNACKAILVPNYDQGKLQLIVKETLASQQGAQVPGSNYNNPISSKLVTGQAANGYVAYDFNESNIVKRNGKSTLQITQSPVQGAANRISFTFQNAENYYANETLTVVDTEDVARVGQELPGSMAVDGIITHDHGMRAVSTWMAESYRGNPRLSADGQSIGDTGGTLAFEFETSVKAVHLKLGQICRLSYQQYGIVNWLFRVTKIQPATNFETVKISGTYHNDTWYLDSFGQGGTPKFRPGFRNRLERPSFPWAPYAEQPIAGDSMFPATEWNFRLAQDYETAADGTSIAKLTVTGKLPVNTFPTTPEPPYVDQQGAAATTGGTLAGDRVYFLAVCAKDQAGANYKLSAPSKICTISVPAGTNTNTVTLTGVVWGAGAAGYVLFAGTDPNRLTYQKDGDTLPTSITLTDYNECSWGMPDSEFDKMEYRVKRILHAGVWGQEIISCTSNTIKVSVLAGANAGFQTNQWAGYDVSLVAMKGESGPLPIVSFRVQSNDRDTLTLAAGAPDPTAIPRPSGTTGLQAGDVLIMRVKPNVGSDAGGNYIEDPNFVNCLGWMEEPYSIQAASNASPIQITTLQPHPYQTGDRVYIQGVNGNTAANDLWTVTVIDSTNFTLNGSTGSGAYTNGGTAYRMTQGLKPGIEVGRILRFISGKGRGMRCKVKSNTATRFYIEGDWPITPDQTSRFIVEEQAWQIDVTSESATNDNAQTDVSTTLNVDNYRRQMLLVQALTMDGGGDTSQEYFSPVREVYLFGGAGTVSFTGAVYMSVEGTLAIGSDLAPRVSLHKEAAAVAVRAEVKQAPVGADLVIKIYTDATLFMALTMAAGTTIIEATQAELAAAPAIPEGAHIKLDITSTGTTFPGADLSVIIFV